MTKIQKSIFIPAPVEEVFRYASDWEKWQEWFSGVSNFRPVTGKRMENETRFAYKAKMMGWTVGVVTEIFDFEKNKGWKGKAVKGMPHSTQWIFKPADGGTHFTYIMEYDLPMPWLTLFLDRTMVTPQWNKILEQALDNLKKQLDQ